MEEVDEGGETEMNRRNLHLTRWSIVLFIVPAMLACIFFQRPAAEATPSPVPENPGEPTSTTAASEDPPASDEPAPDEPDPLDYLLDLRSVRFNLTASYPDETSSSVQAEIDAAGSMHLKFTAPNMEPPDMPEEFKPPTLPLDFEIYVIDEIDYQLNSEDNRWSANTEPTDYRNKLSEQLHGPAGPGLWLDLLPDGSLQSAGEESVGGFTTEKVTVNGLVADQTITGSLWFDTESYALVQVELHVPAALLSAGEEPVQGELKITLEAQKADVPPISVPR